MPSSDPLPPKESAIFRKLLKCYEMKQYKNGLKLSKQILSNTKFTEHGETLAMKGLILNCLGRKEEAYEHVKRGLRNDLRSHVCWHVYGILQRTDKKYDGAIKCYRNALKWDKDNIQILRDLSLLQIQMRDLDGYRDTRYQLFKLRPSQHASWIGFAMSYHLLGDYETASDILESFRMTQTVETPHDYKHSELLLYQNQVIIEAGHYERALQHLEEFQSQILDKLAVKETMGDLCLKLQNHSEACIIYRDLIKRNPENTLYYQKYLEACQITEPSEVVAIYKEFQEQYPRAMCPKRLPLDVAKGDEFRGLIDEYLRRQLRKGVPPLFVSLRSLYRDPSKVAVIEDLVTGYGKNLLESGYFAAEDVGKVEKEPASTELWNLYFLAQHWDFRRNTVKALAFIDAAIEHTPTLIELFVTKGRIFKHAGDLVQAVKWLDEAQSLDTADRYINSKCAKYMLRANQVKEAEEVCAKFTREGVSAMENLNEMQCMWFQTECAAAFQRLERWGESLKKCHEVERHFAEIIEDQFDFHTYCMRKMTLRSYVGLLRLEDVLTRHPFYFRAAKCAIEVYIRLHDRPLPAESSTQEIDVENLPPSELKKMKRKQAKALRKAEMESAAQQKEKEKKEQHNKSSRKDQNADGDPEAPQLDELIPDKLARPENPLDKALDFLRPLQQLAKDNIDTHLMSFEIYYRRRRPLLMLQSLKRAVKIDPNHAGVYGCSVRFCEVLEDYLRGSDVDPSVRTVIENGKRELLRGHTAKKLTEEVLAKHGSSVPHVLEVAKWVQAHDTPQKGAILKRLLGLDVGQMILPDAIKIYKALQSGELGDEGVKEVDSFVETCRRIFPYALVFMPPGEVNTSLNETSNKSENHLTDSDGGNETTNEIPPSSTKTNAQKKKNNNNH